MKKKKLIGRISDYLQKLHEKIFGELKILKRCKVHTDANGLKYFDFESTRYCWNDVKHIYTKYVIQLPQTYNDIISAGSGLELREAKLREHFLGKNMITVEVSSIGCALYKEFFSYFYFYQFFCLWVWFAFMYWPVGILITSIVTMSGFLKIIIARLSQIQVKKVAEFCEVVKIFRDNEWKMHTSDHLVPGDIFEFSSHQIVACDAVIISGRCIVDESSLTGEPTAVPKMNLPHSNHVYAKKSEDFKYTLFAGTRIESVSGADRRAMCIAIGSETNKGELVHKLLNPSNLSFKFDQHWRLIFTILLIYGIFAMILCIYMMNWLLVGWYYGLFTISQIVSPLIPAVFVAGQANAAQRLRLKNIFCIDLQRVLVAGKIKIFCFDKTGTLTTSGLDLYGVIPIENKKIMKDRSLTNSKSLEREEIPKEQKYKGEYEFEECIRDYDKMNSLCQLFLGTCHDLDVCSMNVEDASFEIEKEEEDNYESKGSCCSFISNMKNYTRCCINYLCINMQKCMFWKSRVLVNDDEAEKSDTILKDTSVILSEETDNLVGNEVDRSMFKSSGFTISYENDMRILTCSNTNNKYRTLKRFEFDRRTMTMSVIIQNITTGEKIILCKGSYELIANCVQQQFLPKNYKEITTKVAKEGYYAIGMAFGIYNGPENVENASRETIEKNLFPLGLLLFKNELKHDTIEVIQELKGGKIRPVMITGDNVYTAIKIARESCISTAQSVFIVDVKEGTTQLELFDYDTDVRYYTFMPFMDDLKKGNVELALTGSSFDVLMSKFLISEIKSCAECKSVGSLFCTEHKYIDVPSSFIRNCYSIDQYTDENRFFTLTKKELAQFTRIYARMKPQQKVEAVSNNMRVAVTAMCGDGANDAGALRMAHCGIALAGANCQGTIVAPFSTCRKSLYCVIDVIKYGRCALASALSGYKALIIYGQVLVALSLMQYYLGVMPPEPYWFTWDGVVGVAMAWAIMQSYPAKKLAPYRPTSKLLGFETCASAMMQIFWNWFWMILAVVILYRQRWFICNEFDSNLIDQGSWWLKGDNYEGVLAGIITLFQLISTAFVFNFGFDYRRAWFRNYWLIIFFSIGFGFTSYLLLGGPSALTCLYRTNCGDWSLVQRWGEINKIAKLSYKPSTMPDGCSCNYQIVYSETCEAEYINCTESKYNQRFHHNIYPEDFRWWMFFLNVANFICCVASERIITVGPVRRYLRKKKNMKDNDCSSVVIVGNNKPKVSVDMFSSCVEKKNTFLYDSCVIKGSMSLSNKNDIDKNNNNEQSCKNRKSHYSNIKFISKNNEYDKCCNSNKNEHTIEQYNCDIDGRKRSIHPPTVLPTNFS